MGHLADKPADAIPHARLLLGDRSPRRECQNATDRVPDEDSADIGGPTGGRCRANVSRGSLVRGSPRNSLLPSASYRSRQADQAAAIARRTRALSKKRPSTVEILVELVGRDQERSAACMKRWNSHGVTARVCASDHRRARSWKDAPSRRSSGATRSACVARSFPAVPMKRKRDALMVRGSMGSDPFTRQQSAKFAGQPCPASDRTRSRGRARERKGSALCLDCGASRLRAPTARRRCFSCSTTFSGATPHLRNCSITWFG